MSKPANGRVPSTALVLVQTGTFLGHPYQIELETATAAAYKRAQAAGGLTIAADLGGYRSYAAQGDLKAHPADHGSTLPSSKIAGAGSSTHGYGDVVDIAAGNAWFQVHCDEYDFVRESPAGENNHYRYLHPTWAASTPVQTNLTLDEVKRVASYLNGRGLGKSTTASSTGLNMAPGASTSNYYWEIQKAGAADGLYPQPAYRINGIPGPKTYELEKHYRDLTAPVVPPVTTPPVVDPPVVTPPPVEPPVEPPVVDPPVVVPPVVDPPVVDPPVVVPPVTTPAVPKSAWAGGIGLVVAAVITAIIAFFVR